MPSNLKYKYPQDHVVQQILKNKNTEVVEEIRQSTVSKNNYYKYAAVATEEVTASIEEQSTTIDEMFSSINQLREMANDLQNSIKFFKI